jgi:hypothetical protein
MAEKTRSEKFYGKKDSGKKDDKKSDAKSEHPHVAERKNTHARHAKARDDMHKQHEEELAAMAARQAMEGQGAPGNEAAPAAGPIPTAAAAAPQA